MPAMKFASVDFPTFGDPTITIFVLFVSLNPSKGFKFAELIFVAEHEPGRKPLRLQFPAAKDKQKVAG